MTLEDRVIESLEKEGYTLISTIEDNPEATYEMHKHQNETAHIVIKGTMEITFNEVTYVLKKGDRCDVPQLMQHSAKVGDAGCTYVVGEK
jgi:mannose-6-phosphate isomerase-like protein (cupin superfamily)